MKRHGPLFALIAILAALVVGVAALFQLRLAQGDVFPAYSSLRADPLGTRALHDALAQLPAVRVTRQHEPMGDLPALPRRTIVMAGIRARDWSHMTRDEFDPLEAAVRGGSRLVLALRAEAATDAAEKAATKKAEDERAQKKKKTKDEKSADDAPRVVYVNLKQRWGADLKDRMLFERDGAVAALADEARAAGLPERIGWRSELYFDLAPEADWHVLYRRGGAAVLVERRLGLGSIVLAADSYFLSNEALQNDRATALLSWALGSNRAIEFDEAHLGVVSERGVAALARHYGLSRAFFTLLFLAVLFIWQRSVLFVPPADAEHEVALTYHPAAGLEALLRRAIAPRDLIAACSTEWKPTARESDRGRVETALNRLPANASPLERYNAAARALTKRFS